MDKSVNNLDQNLQSKDADNGSLVSDNKPEIDDKQPEKHKHRTVGNRIYDFGVFGSVAWAGVSAVSALGAYEAMHGNNKNFDWFRNLTKNLYSGLKNTLSKGIMKNAKPETVDAVSKNTTMVFALGMGGHTLMPLIKWMEDHRQSNAAKIDKALGTTPPDAKEVEKEPKQSWKSVFSGRLISWASAFAVVLAVPHKITSKVNDYFGEKGAEAWMKFKPKSNPAKVRRWSDIISFDLAFTALTATVTWAFSRFIAKKNSKTLDEAEEAVYQLNPIAPNPLGEEEREPEKQSNFVNKVQSQNPSMKDPAATAFIDKIKGDEKAHIAAASFIDKINSEANLSPARV